MTEEDGSNWFVEEFRPEPFYFWYDMKPDGSAEARPVRFIDGKMVFLDEHTKNA